MDVAHAHNVVIWPNAGLNLFVGFGGGAFGKDNFFFFAGQCDTVGSQHVYITNEHKNGEIFSAGFAFGNYDFAFLVHVGFLEANVKSMAFSPCVLDQHTLSWEARRAETRMGSDEASSQGGYSL